MKVAQLARLLDSIVLGLDGVVNTTVAAEVRNFADAMQPFGNASVAEFTKFLGQFGLEFQQTGKITTQGKISVNKPARAPKENAAQLVTTAVVTIKELFAEIDRGSVDDNRVEQVLEPVTKLTVPQLHQVLAGLEIAEKPRTKAKVIDKIRQVVHHQVESRARAASVASHPVPLESTKSFF
jgi:hypothetical protein